LALLIPSIIVVSTLEKRLLCPRYLPSKVAEAALKANWHSHFFYPLTASAPYLVI